ncbi:MAG TPA: hypothetical protein VGQ00_01705, partial [Candidatus Norongarragalinales archaeon]|nr:hypothetical protein [Candidatus Norongarragalinales archaeon]
EAPVVSEAILGDLVVKLPFEVPYDVETLNASDGLLVSGSEARLVNARAGEKYKWVGVSLEQVARVVSFKSVDDVETNSTLVTLSIDSSENAWARYSVLGASAAVPPAVLSGDALRFELAKGSNSVSYVVLKNASSSFAQPVVDVSLLESRFDSLKRECEGLDVSCASLEWSFRAMQSALSRGDSGAFESLALQVEKELSAQREKSLKESGELSQALEDFQGLREKFDAIEQELGVALETDVEGARLGALTLAKQDAVKAVKWRDKLDRASSGGLNLSVGEFKSAFTAFSSAVSGLEDDLLQARASAASEVSAAEQRGAQFPDASSKDLLEKSRSALGDGHLLTAFAIANGLNRDFRLAEGGASVGVAGGLPFWLWGAAGVGVLIVLFVVVRAQSQTRGKKDDGFFGLDQ